MYFLQWLYYISIHVCKFSKQGSKEIYGEQYRNCALTSLLNSLPLLCLFVHILDHFRWHAIFTSNLQRKKFWKCSYSISTNNNHLEDQNTDKKLKTRTSMNIYWCLQWILGMIGQKNILPQPYRRLSSCPASMHCTLFLLLSSHRW